MGRASCYHGVPGGCGVCDGLDRRRRENDALRARAERSRSDEEWTTVVRAASRQELTELADEERAVRERIALVLARDAGPAGGWARWTRRRRGGWTA